jgi:hypothetical protein
MKNVSFKLIMLEKDYEKYAGALKEGQLEVSPPEPLETPKDDVLVDARFVELVGLMVTGALTAMTLRLFDLLVQRKDNGTIIDFRKDPPAVSLVANVPYGTLVVIDENGQSQIKKIDPNKSADAKELITGIIENHLKQ